MGRNIRTWPITEFFVERPVFSAAKVIRVSWRLLTSLKLALILIFIMIAVCLIGALFIQVPAEMAVNDELYQSWVDYAAISKYGLWAGPLSFLGFFDIFHSPWFVITGILLMVNIFSCTINRYKVIALNMFQGQVQQQKTFFQDNANSKSLIIKNPAHGIKTQVISTLKSRRYGVKISEIPDAICIMGNKNRISPAGTLLTHLSLILFVLGFIIGSFLGFRDSSLVVAENSLKNIGHETGLSIEVLSFEDEYWPDGRPKDYRSQVVLYENDREVKRATVRVNSPLHYKGTNIYQASFGSSVNIMAKNGNDILFSEPVVLDQISNDQFLRRDTGFFELRKMGITAQLFSPSTNSPDPIIGNNQLGIILYDSQTGEPVTSDFLEIGAKSVLGDIEFSYVSRGQYTVFQVARNPGITLIWVSASLFILGLVTMFYFPLRRAWIRIESYENGKSRLWMRVTGQPAVMVSKETDEIMERIKISK